MGFAIYEVAVGGGVVALCPMPSSAQDVETVNAWQPSVVVSLTQMFEGATATFEGQFAEWVHVPIVDLGVPEGDELDGIIARSVAIVREGGRVVFHCMGGCGRSGMAVLRVMHLMDVPDALQTLRAIRPCAVETDDQLKWALQPKATTR
jgi:protein-tyrosine phosphatase